MGRPLLDATTLLLGQELLDTPADEEIPPPDEDPPAADEDAPTVDEDAPNDDEDGPTDDDDEVPPPDEDELLLLLLLPAGDGWGQPASHATPHRVRHRKVRFMAGLIGKPYTHAAGSQRALMTRASSSIRVR